MLSKSFDWREKKRNSFHLVILIIGKFYQTTLRTIYSNWYNISLCMCWLIYLFFVLSTVGSQWRRPHIFTHEKQVSFHMFDGLLGWTYFFFISLNSFELERFFRNIFSHENMYNVHSTYSKPSNKAYTSFQVCMQTENGNIFYWQCFYVFRFTYISFFCNVCFGLESRLRFKYIRGSTKFFQLRHNFSASNALNESILLIMKN